MSGVGWGLSLVLRVRARGGLGTVPLCVSHWLPRAEPRALLMPGGPGSPSAEEGVCRRVCAHISLMKKK